MTRRRENLWAALVGLLAAGVTLAIAELGALLLAPASSPLLAVGSLVIDLVPAWVKSLVISLFGTDDKAVLLITLGVLVVALAAGIGILEYRRPPFGIAGLVVVGGIATLAVTTRAESTAVWAVPTVVGMVGGVIVLRLAVVALHRWSRDAASAGPVGRGTPAAVSRRGFLTLLVGAAAASAVVGVAARTMNAGTTAVNAVRTALKLPKPVIAAAPIPAGASFDIDGLAPLVTPNKDFYRIDTALQVPVIDPAQWRLRITGMVEKEIEIGFDELLALPLVETYVTLMCVSNEVGGSLTGNAKWLGYPIRDLLARAKPTKGADVVLSTSQDGFTATTPLEVLQDTERDSLLAVGMNGEALPLEHGYPVRMVVPGLYGYVSATKWVTELRLTRFSKETAYWTDRGWSAEGPIKISSRIDTPKYTSIVGVETLAVAGVAWAQHTGIESVEIRVDKGDWMPTQLAPAISDDTWVQWSTTWTPTEKKVYLIEVRATDKNGEVQSGNPVQPAPDGSEGWHAITIEARA